MLVAILGAVLATALAAEAPLQAGHDVPVPERIHHVAPEYPSIARLASVVGVVVLRVGLNEEGRPVDIKVLHGTPIIDGAAIEAVRQWRYRPTVVSGTGRRVELIEVVEMFPDDRARLDYFVAMVKDTKEPQNYRLLACDRLKALGVRKKSVFAALRKAATDPDERVRAAANDTLAALGEGRK
jgi:TonB family protein